MRQVLGIDLGTSSVKVVLLGEDGAVVATAAQSYPIATPRPGWAEQDPASWWGALRAALASILATPDASPATIAAIGIGGQMHGTVLIDRRGVPLRPAIIWPDQRAANEARAIDGLVVERDLAAALGGGVSPGFMLASLAWLRAYEADAWHAAAHALLPKDYLRYRLTGMIASEPSDGSGIPLVDLLSGAWHQGVLDALDLPASLFPPLLPSGAIAGTVTAEAAAATGLAAGTPVLCGGSDQAMGALGAGLLAPGTLLISISTGGQIVTPLARPLATPGRGLRTLAHAMPGVYLALAATLGAGLSLRWMRERVSSDDGDDAAADARFAALAASAPAGAGGLLFLPYLAGERAPLLDPEAGGALLGLRLDHERAHLARATVEGIVFSLRHALEPLEEAGVVAPRVLLAGGIARSPLVREIAADVLERPVESLRASEQSALGGALLAAVAAGFFPDLQSACAAAVASMQPTEPDPRRSRFYADLYAHYRGLYPKLRDDMHALRDIALSPSRY